MGSDDLYLIWMEANAVDGTIVTLQQKASEKTDDCVRGRGGGDAKYLIGIYKKIYSCKCLEFYNAIVG